RRAVGTDGTLGTAHRLLRLRALGDGMSVHLHNLVHHAGGWSPRAGNHGRADTIDIHRIPAQARDSNLIQGRRYHNFGGMRAEILELLAHTASNRPQVARVDAYAAKFNASNFNGVVDALGDVESIDQQGRAHAMRVHLGLEGSLLIRGAIVVNVRQSP